MAAPITHIVLAKRALEQYFPQMDQAEFFIGTSFPDIRYLGVIERNKTHVQNLSLNDIAQKNSFETGLYFHSLVDEVREKYIISKNIYSLCPSSNYISQSLKLFEDELLYSELNNWKEIRDFFNSILEPEESFGILQQDIIIWHQALQHYFTKMPTPESRAKFISEIGLPSEMGKEINLLIAKFREDIHLRQILLDLYSSFFKLV